MTVLSDPLLEIRIHWKLTVLVWLVELTRNVLLHYSTWMM